MTTAIWSYDYMRDDWGKPARERTWQWGWNLVYLEESGWVGITCIVLFSTLALSQPLRGARPLAALRPPGTSEESGFCGYNTSAMEVRHGDGGRCLTSEQGVVSAWGIWLSEYWITRQRSHSVLLFSSTGLENIHKGENLAPVVYLKVGNDTLAKLDHPYAWALEVPAKNVYTRHGGHAEALGAELPWILLSQ